MDWQSGGYAGAIMNLHASSMWVIVVPLLIAVQTSSSAKQTHSPGGDAGLANPASVNCVDKLRGKLRIVTTAKGQVGYCHLRDGRVCEEWALFRDGLCVTPR